MSWHNIIFTLSFLRILVDHRWAPNADCLVADDALTLTCMGFSDNDLMLIEYLYIFTARCTIVQSAVLRSHVVCLSVRLSVTLVDQEHGLEILETD